MYANFEETDRELVGVLNKELKTIKQTLKDKSWAHHKLTGEVNELKATKDQL